jgi:hypothetical protein
MLEKIPLLVEISSTAVACSSSEHAREPSNWAEDMLHPSSTHPRMLTSYDVDCTGLNIASAEIRNRGCEFAVSSASRAQLAFAPT